MNAGKLMKPPTTQQPKEKGKKNPHTFFRLMEVLDKGKAAAVTTIIETRDKRSGNVIFENQTTVFIRGAGGFGGRRAGKGAVIIFGKN